MLSGTADVDTLAADAPTVSTFATESLACPGAEILQVAWEVWGEAREAVLPPGLHPVTPPTLTWSWLRAPESLVGPFTLAQTRVVCRSGVRGRGFHVAGFVDNSDAAALLTSQWGYRLMIADVLLQRRYHGTHGRVTVSGDVVLDCGLTSPQPLSGDDLQYTDTMHLARTPLGLRLVQVECDYRFGPAERGQPTVAHFAPDKWGQPLLRPSYAVSASSAVADVSVMPVRFVCQPDVSAFVGTERVG
ncbi:MAG TPA: acetoacetate decarboxylase family protein [Acidimicrobiales bacterium]|nr:acetoacetate decarboxylase family protein [Acidimicrobiales bacterium]